LHSPGFLWSNLDFSKGYREKNKKSERRRPPRCNPDPETGWLLSRAMPAHRISERGAQTVFAGIGFSFEHRYMTDHCEAATKSSDGGLLYSSSPVASRAYD
jgi:hypothetical protein